MRPPKTETGSGAGSKPKHNSTFALDTACKSGPVHGQKVIVADTGRDECSSEGTGTILETHHHYAKPTQFAESTPSKPETVVAKPKNCLP